MSSWTTPPYSAPGAPYAPPSPPDGGYALRPLSMGEVLDRTFAVFRRNFWLIAGISAISGAVQLVGSCAQMAANHMAVHHHSSFIAARLVSSVGALLSALVFYLAAAFTQAATVFALSEVYLGRTTTVKESLLAVKDGWWTYPLIGLWQFFSGAWPSMLMFLPAVFLGIFMRGQMAALIALLVLAGFAALAGGVVLYLRNSLAIPVQVIERPGIRAAMRRSKTLSQGAKGTMFVLYLIVAALYFASAGIIGVLAVVLNLTHKGTLQDPTSMFTTALQAAGMVIGFFIHVVIIPIVLVGTAITYFNQRVKLEGFDLLVMLGGGAPAAAAASDLPIPYPPVAPAYPPVPAVYPPVAPGEAGAAAQVYPPAAPAYQPVAAAYPPAAPEGFDPPRDTPIEAPGVASTEAAEPVIETAPEPPAPADDRSH